MLTSRNAFFTGIIWANNRILVTYWPVYRCDVFLNRFMSTICTIKVMFGAHIFHVGKKKPLLNLIAPHKNWDNPPLRMYMYHGVDLGFLAHPPIHTQSDTQYMCTFDLQVKNLVFCLLIKDRNEVCLIAQWTQFLILIILYIATEVLSTTFVQMWIFQNS